MPRGTGDSDLLTLQDLAEYLGIVPRTAYLWSQSGKIPAYKIGTAWRYRKTEIDAWLAEQRVESASTASGGACAVCGRPFGVAIRVAGSCQEEDCVEQICQTCWGPRYRKRCPAHSGSRSQAETEPRMVTQQAIQPGGSVEAGSGLIGRRFLSGFQGRVELRAGLFTRSGRAVARGEGSPRFRRTDSKTERTRLSTSERRTARRRKRKIELADEAVYEFTLLPGALETRHSKLRIGAYLLDGEGVPGIADLERLIANEQGDGDAQSVSAFMSIAGWSPEAEMMLNGPDPSKRYLSPDGSPVLVGPGVADIHYNPSDPLLAELGHYFNASFEDEVAACREVVRTEIGGLLRSQVYFVSRLIEDHGFSKLVVDSAVDYLVRYGEAESVAEGEETVALKGAV